MFESHGLVIKYHNQVPFKLIGADSSGHITVFSTYLPEIHFMNSQKTQQIHHEARYFLQESLIFNDLDFSNDGRKILLSTSKKFPLIFDLEKQVIQKPSGGHHKQIKCAKFCRQNQEIFITGGKDGIIALYDLRIKSPEISQHIIQQKDGITGCHFYNDEKMIICTNYGSLDCHIWDLRLIY